MNIVYILIFIAFILTLIAIALLFLILKNKQTMENIQRLKEAVEKNTQVVASAQTLISGLSSELKAAIEANKNGDNGEALDALSTTLETQNEALANAITANTPAAEGSETAGS